jgi:hypothetical protein
MAQAVSRRPLTAEARVRSRVSPCGICDGQSDTGTVFHCQFHSMGAPLLVKMKKLIFITGLHNKPQGFGASVASAAGPFTTKKIKILHVLVVYSVGICCNNVLPYSVTVCYTHYLSWRCMYVSGQVHTSAALSLSPLRRRLGGPHSRSATVSNKTDYLAGYLIPIFHAMFSHCTLMYLPTHLIYEQ